MSEMQFDEDGLPLEDNPIPQAAPLEEVAENSPAEEATESQASEDAPPQGPVMGDFWRQQASTVLDHPNLSQMGDFGEAAASLARSQLASHNMAQRTRDQRDKARDRVTELEERLEKAVSMIEGYAPKPELSPVDELSGRVSEALRSHMDEALEGRLGPVEQRMAEAEERRQQEAALAQQQRRNYQIQSALQHEVAADPRVAEKVQGYVISEAERVFALMPPEYPEAERRRVALQQGAVRAATLLEQGAAFGDPLRAFRGGTSLQNGGAPQQHPGSPQQSTPQNPNQAPTGVPPRISPNATSGSPPRKKAADMTTEEYFQLLSELEAKGINTNDPNNPFPVENYLGEM